MDETVGVLAVFDMITTDLVTKPEQLSFILKKMWMHFKQGKTF